MLLIHALNKLSNAGHKSKMFFTKVYGYVQSTKYVSHLSMHLDCVSVSHDSRAFSNYNLFQILSLGHGLQKASVKSRTVSSCCPAPLPCLHVCGEPAVNGDAGPYQQIAQPSSTPGFLFSSLSPR